MDHHRLQGLESLLRRWAIWCKHWHMPNLGFPPEAVWAKGYAARYPIAHDDEEDRLENWEVHAVDASVSDLPKPHRRLVEMRWLERQRIPDEQLADTYVLVVRGLTNRNVLL